MGVRRKNDSKLPTDDDVSGIDRVRWRAAPCYRQSRSFFFTVYPVALAAFDNLQNLLKNEALHFAHGQELDTKWVTVQCLSTL